MKRVLLLLVLFFVMTPASAEIYQIGVLAFNGKPEAIKRWQPTADYLSQQVAGAHFSIMPLTHQEFEHAINKGELDFILTNPGHYVLLEVRFGITRIATFLSRHEQQTLNRFSSVIFTRSDSGILTLEDLAGGKLAAVSEGAFGGYQLALLEFRTQGIDLVRDTEIKWLGFPHTDVVRAVVEGRADAGTVRSGILEKMARQKLLDLSSIRILAKKESPGFPFLHSSALYPEWPISRLPHTDLELAKRVTISLLKMQADDPAARRSLGSGWTIPLSYSSVHGVLRQLQVEPYLPAPMVVSDFLQVYRHWIGPIVILFLVALIALLRLIHTNRQLKSTQKMLREHQLLLEDTVQERTDELLQTNQTLQIEIASHVEAENVLSEGCKSLQALYDIFIRNDLDRQQKLNSIVDSLRRYIGTEYARLCGVKGEQYQVFSTSPSDAELEIPLSPELAKQAILERQVIMRDNTDKWRRYTACPIFIRGELYCLIEFASSGQYQDDNVESTQKISSELSMRILSLISQWVGNETMLLEQEIQDRNRNKDAVKRFESLSPREKQVLKLLVDGESSKVMARELNISTKTVEMHRANLLRKTHAKSSTELVQLAVNSGIFG